VAKSIPHGSSGRRHGASLPSQRAQYYRPSTARSQLQGEAQSIQPPTKRHTCRCSRVRHLRFAIGPARSRQRVCCDVAAHWQPSPTELQRRPRQEQRQMNRSIPNMRRWQSSSILMGVRCTSATSVSCERVRDLGMAAATASASSADGLGAGHGHGERVVIRALVFPLSFLFRACSASTRHLRNRASMHSCPATHLRRRPGRRLEPVSRHPGASRPSRLPSCRCASFRAGPMFANRRSQVLTLLSMDGRDFDSALAPPGWLVCHTPCITSSTAA